MLKTSLSALLAVTTLFMPIAAESEPVAVVELFTSEGCSSCPPAETLLNELNAASLEADGPRVIALSFHVDYWDRLGWKDPYGDRRFSLRQRGYATRLEGGQSYTPNMVVNGSVSFVGSSRRNAQEAIAAALKAPVPVDVSAEVVSWEQGAVEVAWAVEGGATLPEGTQLSVALVEDGIVSDIARGENRGRTLRHDAVVRGWASVDAQASGHTALTLPEDMQAHRGAVVLLVQMADTGVVLGASRVPLVTDG